MPQNGSIATLAGVSLSADNEGAVLARAGVLIERLEERRRQNAVNEPLVTLLDLDDLAALRHTAGIVLALLALGPEAEAAPAVENELRDALVALIPLLQAASALLDRLMETEEGR
jgi:hypothetical protein